MTERGVQIESWGPFAEGRNNLFSEPTLTGIASAHGKSVAQVVPRDARHIRYVQRDPRVAVAIYSVPGPPGGENLYTAAWMAAADPTELPFEQRDQALSALSWVLRHRVRSSRSCYISNQDRSGPLVAAALP